MEQNEKNTAPVIPLGPHTRKAIEADIAEINHIQALLQSKMAQHKRYTDAIVADAGHDPAQVAQYELVDGGMLLIPRKE
jgi:hypothetical protein